MEVKQITELKKEIENITQEINAFSFEIKYSEVLNTYYNIKEEYMKAREKAFKEGLSVPVSDCYEHKQELETKINNDWDKINDKLQEKLQEYNKLKDEYNFIFNNFNVKNKLQLGSIYKLLFNNNKTYLLNKKDTWSYLNYIKQKLQGNYKNNGYFYKIIENSIKN